MEYLDTTKSIEERVKSLLSLLTIEEKIGLLASDQQPIARLGIAHRDIGTEYARGWSSHEETEYCTVFPQTIGMAGTFDEALIHEAGKVAGRESRAYYNDRNKSLFGFGPTVDMERDIRWGRHEEGYGEDPCLAGVMASSYTRGITGDGPVKQALPLLKHFICNNTETDRATYDAKVGMRLLNEYYLEPFRKPIMDGGAYGVMGAYNKINGEPGLVTSLNQKYVKDRWGGRLVVSDGHAFAMVSEMHHYTDSYAETLSLAVKSGANIMLDRAEMIIDAAKEALSNNLMTEADVDKAIYDTLYLRFLLGEFDGSENDPYGKYDLSMVNTESDKALALRMSEEQMVLLKNDGILPLKTKKLAIIGPQADENFMDWYTGASSYDITVKNGFTAALPDVSVTCDSGRDIVRLKHVKTGCYLRVHEDLSVTVDATVADAASFEKYDWGFGYVNFMHTETGKMLQEDEDMIRCTALNAYMWFVRPILSPTPMEEGVAFTSWNRRNIKLTGDNTLVLSDDAFTEEDAFLIEVLSSGDDRCKALAAEADTVICCVGNHPTQVGREGYDRESIALPPRQAQLVDTALSVNPNTILFIVSSYPFGIDRYDKECRAVLYSTHTGPELGQAAANIFLGKANPAGRCANTWYRLDTALPSIFDYDIEKNRMTYLYLDQAPLYPFGYGLSYSTFAYEKLVPAGEDETKLYFEVTVRNTSSVDGDEVVQLYFTKKDSRYQRPNRKLIAFKRQLVPAGSSVTFCLVAEKHLLQSFDESLDDFVMEHGSYHFYAGPSCDRELLSIDLTL